VRDSGSELGIHRAVVAFIVAVRAVALVVACSSGGLAQMLVFAAPATIH